MRFRDALALELKKVSFRGQRMSRAQRRGLAGQSMGYDKGQLQSWGRSQENDFDTTVQRAFDHAESPKRNASSMFHAQFSRAQDMLADGKLSREARIGLGGASKAGDLKTKYTKEKRAYYMRRAKAMTDARTKEENAPHPNRRKRR
jgi:hypothetical protein